MKRMKPHHSHDQERCTGCAQFLPPDDSEWYFHSSKRGASADEWDFHPLAAFCTEDCADRWHANAAAEVKS